MSRVLAVSKKHFFYISREDLPAMSFNQFMHPRNLYRNKPSYEKLAKLFPDFASHCVFDQKGKAYIDYDDPGALRSLTKTLLNNDFGLDVTIPEDRLIPTLPMRLNYILWIEDLLQFLQITNERIVGLDIGTGSCAIFPLLATVLHRNYCFIATDIDAVNLNYAKTNINNNHLSDRIIRKFQLITFIKVKTFVISVLENTTDSIFKFVFNSSKFSKINFLMTNPPFFSDTFNDSTESTNSKSFHSKRTNPSCLNEAVVEGGEVTFIKNIIQESIESKELIDIYSVMIGRKKSFLELKQLFKDYVEQNVISSFTYTELCQGNTKRWAVAWTFRCDFSLSAAPQIKCIKPKPLVFYISSDINCCVYDMESISDYIRDLLVKDLEIYSFSMIKLKKTIEFDIKANSEPWRNQRKKRRQQKTVSNHHSESTNESVKSDTPGVKRAIDDDEVMEEVGEKKAKDCSDLCKANLTYLLHCSLTIKRDKQEIFIKMITEQMSQNKESTFQLFQYFKNKLS